MRLARSTLAVVLSMVIVWPVVACATIYWTPAHELAPVGWGGGMAAGDLDADGDTDISALAPDPAYQFWNTGTPAVPVWTLDLTQYSEVMACSYRRGDLGDVDADGDLDLVVGCYYEEALRLYWNVGGPVSPAWVLAGGVVESVECYISDTAPRFADMDADGDLDLLVAAGSGRVRYSANIGTASMPLYSGLSLVESVPPSGGAGPCIAVDDLDGDDDFDIIRVTFDTEPECFENIGTPQAYAFAENPSLLTGVSCPGGAYGVELLDADADGDPDLLFFVSGASGDEHLLYLNGSATPVKATSWGVIKAMYRDGSR